jgi:hypothetical protein
LCKSNPRNGLDRQMPDPNGQGALRCQTSAED